MNEIYAEAQDFDLKVKKWVPEAIIDFYIHEIFRIHFDLFNDLSDSDNDYPAEIRAFYELHKDEVGDGRLHGLIFEKVAKAIC